MIIINGPNGDNCDICGKHVSELQPFLEPPYTYEGIVDGICYMPYMRPDTKLAKRFRRYDYGEYGDSVGSSWECRDCFYLLNDEAIDLQFARYWAEQEAKP